MRVVSITRLLDEADIIESFVRHTATYASHLIFVDNGSRDGTLEILQQLQAEGFRLLVYQNKSVSYKEADFNTKMFKDAVDLFGADWVLCLDADEFIDDSHVDGGLLAAFERMRDIEPAVLSVRVPLFEYRRSQTHYDADEINVALRLRHRFAPFGVDKVFVSSASAASDATISGGNHYAIVRGERVESQEEPGLRLAHFSERSAHQIVAKWIKGWAKILATGPEVAASGASFHYREPFRLLCDSPEILLRNSSFLELHAAHPLTDDAMSYRGGPLLYTRQIDDQMRAVRMVVGYLEELSSRYGYLLEHCPEAKAVVDLWDERLDIVLGRELTRIDLFAPLAPTLLTTNRQAVGSRTRRFFSYFKRWPFRNNKTSVEQILLLSSKEIESGHFKEADSMIATALVAEPGKPELLKQYALSAHNSGRYDIAIGRWGNALRSAPNDAMCHAGLAANLREYGELRRASDVIGTALSRFPNDGIVLTEAARIEIARYRPLEALSLLEKAISVCGPLLDLTKKRDLLKVEINAQSAADFEERVLR